MSQIKKKEGYVYLIRTLSMDPFYIGSTHDCSQRFKHHKYNLRKGTHHCQRLQRIFNKYGFDNLVFSIIKEFKTRTGSQPNSKSVIKIDPNGIETKYDSAAEAARDNIGFHINSISRCCLGRGKTGGGYKWRFA